ncbi:EAL domain-containing protein [Paenibacillus soyae]|uniref:EAL domain-containing protein n=1 Tax=Paenibacillus soyae TaxID=2969249 RepID=UPI0035305004
MNKLEFEVKIEEPEHLHRLLAIFKPCNERAAEIKVSEHGHLMMNESLMRGFVDFCTDHLNGIEILFRTSGEDWLPLSSAEAVFDAKWIDGVIAEEAVRFDFQPIVDLKGKTYGYECLARFWREDGTRVSPAEAFAAAKTRGRLYALDRMCRLAALRMTADMDPAWKVFINFIPTSIYSPEFCLKSTVDLANQLGISPDRFVFEVVETEWVEDVEHLKRVLAYYREKGFAYALDDVGEGYSTIEMLADLRPHFMKLDMKYVRGVSEDSRKQRVASTFLEKALQLGSVPLAEGIETREELEWLRQRGYQLFQGYLFGKPGTFSEMQQRGARLA